jgi:hypothetical protein
MTTPAAENSALTPAEPGPVLFLSYHYPPDTSVGGARAARFIRHLGEFGQTGYVVTASPGESTATILRVLIDQASGIGTAFAKRVLAGLERVLPYNDRLPWAPQAIAAASRLFRRVPIGTVISTSPPLAVHFAAYWLRKRYGVRWVADFRDPLVGNPSRTRAWGHRYDAAIERWIIGAADAVIANTDAVQALWQQRYPQHADKIHMIWNGFDLDQPVEIAPAPSRAYRLLLHAGTIYGPRHPGALLASLDRLISAGKLNPAGIRFRQVGWIENPALFDPDAVRRLTERGCFERIDQVPTEEARRYEASADSFFVLDWPSGLQVPAKLYGLIRLGRPILALTPAGSPVGRILKQSGVPHSCFDTIDSPEEIDKKVQGFFSLPASPVPPTPWFLDNFNATTQARQLCSIIRGLTQSEGHTLASPGLTY